MTTPKRNLGESEQWGRVTEKEIEELNRRIRALEGAKKITSQGQSILSGLVAKAEVKDQLMQSQLDFQGTVTYSDIPPSSGIDDPGDPDADGEYFPPPDPDGEENTSDPDAIDDPDPIPEPEEDETELSPEHTWVHIDPATGEIQREYRLVDYEWEPITVGTGYIADGAVHKEKIEKAVTDAIDEAVEQSEFAVEAVNGKNTNYTSASEPTEPEGGFTVGDIWFDISTPGETVIKTWNGSAWVDRKLGMDALGDDVTVAIEAGGGNQIFSGPVEPEGPFKEGDTWYDTSVDGATYAWTGEPDNSTATRTTDEGTVTNLFTNPDMVATSGDVVVWENLIPDPDPSLDTSAYTRTGVSPSDHEDGRLITFEEAMEAGSTTFYRTASSNGHTPVEEGEVYSARGGVRNISDWPVTLRFGMIRTTGASLVLSSARSDDVTVQPGEYVEIEVPGIELNDTWNTVRVGWVAPSEGEIPAGTEIVLSDGFTVMKGPRAPLLVSTVFSPDPDLTPQARPEGGSQLVGQQVAGVSALRGVVVKSSQWSKSQGVSARFITTEEAAGNNLPLGIVGVFGSPVGGVVVWRRQGATIGEFGSPTGDSNLSILTGTGDASDPAVNAPGETLMRVALDEIAPNGAQVYLPGGGNVGDSVWFDILTVTDESYDGPPFSGATPTDIQGSTIKTWNGEAWKVEALDHESLAVGAVTANTIRANAITSAKIASDAIEARHIQTGTIQAGDGIIGSLDAGVISAGTLDADRIGAKTITAEKLLIGRPRDLAPGPGGYEDLYDLGSAAMFLGSSNDPTGRYIGISPDVSGASNRMVFGPMTPVREGEIISWESYATYGGTNPATNWSTYLYWYDVNGDALDPERTVITTESASGGSTGWSRATVEVPEGAEWARARFYSVYDEAATGNRGFRNFDIRVQTSGTLIEDGAITTDKIAANAVEATNIAANAITSDKIEANAITGDKIRANAIDGMTITGATIQTSPEAISQIKLDQNSLVVNSSAPGIEIDRWYSVPLRGFSSIDQINGYVVGTTLENPSVMILNSKGEIYAFRSAGNALADSVTITGGYAYVVHPNGSVWRAVDPFTSFSVWTTARRADKISSHSSGGVYGIHTGDNVVFSYNSSGSVAWTKTHSSPTSIHVTSNRVFVGLTGTTNRVIELDLSGNLIQAFTVNHFGEYLLVQDGVAYISNADDKKVYVEELGSGQVLLTLSQGGDAVPGGLMNYQGNLAIAWRSPTVGSSEGGVSFHSFTDESKEMVHIDSSSGVLTARSARLPGHSSIKSAEMSVIAPPVGESLNIINPLFKSGFNIVKSKAERLNSHQSFQEGAIVSEAGGIAGQSLWMRSSSRQENNHARNWIKIGPSAESLMGGDPSPSGKITGANLNTFNRDSGGWIQENDSYATSARNYPVNVGGILKVSRRTDFNEANNEFFTQEYITRETNSRYFIRHYIISSTGSKSWTPWTQIGGPDPSKPFAMASGTVSVTASEGIGETTVTFPSGRFTKTPQVFTTGNSAVTALQNTQIASPTTTSVRIVMQRSTGTATSVDWLAVQMEE